MSLEPDERRTKPNAVKTSRKTRQVHSRPLLSLIRGGIHREDGSGVLILVMVLAALALIGRLLKVI
ncbi:hypothetical protein [Acidocella sp.]|uniref:hypothetical protein n=1 Tax=Acidocella sp. TaxID=50710 RepID=UPI0018540E1E|nr:hypothetical protein [Acidocella sp.]MDR3737203.1 hypothetical protein [Acidobacteriaceae bacterium]NNM56495.1 hypothetical protein [Acidocella sp.]